MLLWFTDGEMDLINAWQSAHKHANTTNRLLREGVDSVITGGSKGLKWVVVNHGTICQVGPGFSEVTTE